MKVATTLFFFLISFFSIQTTVLAGANDRFDGWAWSPNIGWVSFNCTNTNYCATVQYGVTLAGDGTSITGWAWSENIGWIDMSGATFNKATGAITGTVSAVTGTIEADGWDGLIYLSDTAPIAYGGVVAMDDDVDGYAWGGTVVGWLSYNCANTGTCGIVDYAVRVTPFAFEFTADGGLTPATKVAYGGGVTLSWTTDGAVSCTAFDGGTTTWRTPAAKTAGEPTPASFFVDNLLVNTLFTLRCQNSAGKQVTKALTIFVATPPPSLTLTADDTNIGFNTATTIRWDALNIASCSASGAWSGAKAVGAGRSQSSGSLTSSSNNFSLTCSSNAPLDYPTPVFALVTIFVEKLSLNFMATPSTIPYSDPALLQWETEWASSCTASGGEGTTWATVPAKAFADGVRTQEVFKSGTTLKLDPGSYSFTLTCNGSSGQQSIKTTVLKVGRNPNFSEDLTVENQGL